MADTPFPLPKSVRSTGWLIGDGRTTYGPYGDGWGIFDDDDVAVDVRPAAVAFTVEKIVLSAKYSAFQVTFARALTAADNFRVKGKRLHRRQLAVTRGGRVDGMSLELELSKQSVVLQEQTRDIGELQGYQDDAAASAVSAAAAEVAAENAAVSSAASAAVAALYAPAYFEDVAAMLADVRAWPDGQLLNTRKEGFSYKVAAAAATDHQLVTAGGEKIYVNPLPDGSVSFLQFGGKHDGGGVVAGTDNAPVFNKMGDFARAAAVAGKPAILRFEPGKIDFNLGNCLTALANIPKLKFIAHGAIFRNTYPGPAAFSKDISWFRAMDLPLQVHAQSEGDLVYAGALAYEGDKIATVAAGTKVVTFLSPVAPTPLKDTPPYDAGATKVYFDGASGLAEYVVGEWVMVGSLTVQPAGYPPNLDRFDYAKVASVNIGAGTLTLDRALTYTHRSDFPEVWLPPPVNSIAPQGAARIWRMSRYEQFDIDHIFEGMTVSQPSNPATAAYNNYMIVSGRRVSFRDCELAGYGMSTGMEAHFEDCLFKGNGEVDKVFDRITADNCTFENGMNLVSPSNSYLSRGSNYLQKDDGLLYSLQIGGMKNVEIEGGYIEKLQFFTPLGLNRNTKLKNVRVGAVAGGNTWHPDAWTGVTVFGAGPNGEAWAYANGVITFSNFAASIIATQGFLASIVPGQVINLAGPGNIYTGPVGDAVVLSVTQGGTFANPTFIITTNYQSAALPGWVTGFRIQRYQQIDIQDCYGCPQIEIASRAAAKGLSPFGYWATKLAGQQAQNINVPIIGQVKRLRFNVIKPAPAGARFSINSIGYNPTASFAGNNFGYSFDIATYGDRDFKPSQANIGTDFHNGTGDTTLPVNQWSSGNWFMLFSVNPNTWTAQQQPEIDIEIETDTGNLGRATTGTIIQG